LSVDPGRFVLLGRSTGAQLALFEPYTGGDESIRVVVSFYGPIDPPYAYAHPTNPKVANIRRLLEDYLDGSPEVREEGYREASPVNFASSCSPLTLFVHNSRDDMVQAPQRTPRQSTREALGATPLGPAPVGAPRLRSHSPWPGGRLSTYAVEAFLAAVAGRDTP
jgi:acetyl esterase/lipase